MRLSILDLISQFDEPLLNFREEDEVGDRPSENDPRHEISEEGSHEVGEHVWHLVSPQEHVFVRPVVQEGPDEGQRDGLGDQG